jgi:HD-GYP domain-containing protein (c-di-GMP phosphodiesterase class II)
MAAVEENSPYGVPSGSPPPVVPVPVEAPEDTEMGVDGQPSDGPDPVLAAIVEALSRALELHDYRRGVYGETAAHTERVTQLALRLTRRVAPELAEDPQLAAGFRLHDIGMIGIPITVISKPGPLSEDEVNEIQEHPWLGERIVAPIAALGPLTRQVVACHHERWDGTGYPRGLRGNEIPVSARIFAIVDVYDSMTNAQPYREALSNHVAIAEIDAGSGKAFDPEIASEFVAMFVEELGSTRPSAAGKSAQADDAPPASDAFSPTDQEYGSSD